MHYHPNPLEGEGASGGGHPLGAIDSTSRHIQPEIFLPAEICAPRSSVLVSLTGGIHGRKLVVDHPEALLERCVLRYGQEALRVPELLR